MTTSADINDAAALNNALWCDAVCRTHDRPGIFGTLLWATKLGAPNLYPDVVTLAGPGSAAAQRHAIAALIERGRPGGWAIKDSFAALDLVPMGFRPLFDAQWIAHGGALSNDTPTLHWRAVMDAPSLAAWNAAWGESAPFKPGLLADDDVVFVAAHHGDTLVGGAILNHGAGVVGLSNVFAASRWQGTVWRDLPAQASRLFDGAMLVGYQSGASLDHAIASGFEAIGPLRIWSRPAGRVDSVGASTL
jgi:hypothetical protein